MADNLDAEPPVVPFSMRATTVRHEGIDYAVCCPPGVPRWITVVLHRWSWRRCQRDGHQNLSVPGICPHCGVGIGFPTGSQVPGYDAIDTASGVMRVHRAGECLLDHCCIHNPSDHPLRDAPLSWRADRRVMERVCPHGVTHPDPDSSAYVRYIGRVDADGAHDCCPYGCCGADSLPGAKD